MQFPLEHSTNSVTTRETGKKSTQETIAYTNDALAETLERKKSANIAAPSPIVDIAKGTTESGAKSAEFEDAC